MNDTLFPEYFIEELRQTAGILSGPLKIAGQIILRPDFEKIEASIKNDQLHLLLHYIIVTINDLKSHPVSCFRS